MITFIVMNIFLPGPLVFYSLVFGWLFIPILITIDLTVAGILTAILMRMDGEDNTKVIIPIGLCSVALSYVLVGGVLGIIGIIIFIVKLKDYVFDEDAQKYGIFALMCCIISILMSGIEVYFISLFIT